MGEALKLTASTGDFGPGRDDDPGAHLRTDGAGGHHLQPGSDRGRLPGPRPLHLGGRRRPGRQGRRPTSGIVGSFLLADYVGDQVPLLARTVLHRDQQPTPVESGQSFRSPRSDSARQGRRRSRLSIGDAPMAHAGAAPPSTATVEAPLRPLPPVGQARGFAAALQRPGPLIAQEHRIAGRWRPLGRRGKPRAENHRCARRRHAGSIRRPGRRRRPSPPPRTSPRKLLARSRAKTRSPDHR